MANLQPQAALEQATLNALLASGAPGGEALPASFAKRMYDGQPTKVSGAVFYSVWYDAQRPNQGQRTRFEELFGVYVTITVRFTQPADRWLAHRDDLETRANWVKNLIGQDQVNHVICNAAEALAGFRSSGDPTTGNPAGWVESLLFGGFDPIQTVGPTWFDAATDADAAKPVACAQRIRFSGAKRIQRVQTAVS